MLRTYSVAVALRGLRARAVLTFGSVLLATVATAAAVVGPAYLQAATNSLLVDRLDTASEEYPESAALTWTFAPGPTLVADPHGALQAAKAAAMARAPDEFGPAEATFFTDRFELDDFGQLRDRPVRWRPPAHHLSTGFGDFLPHRVALAALDDGCARLIVEGRCPRRASEFLIAETDVRPGVEPGSRISLPIEGGPAVLVGSYRLDPAAEWSDTAPFTSLPARAGDPPRPYHPAPLLTVPETFERVPPNHWHVDVDRPLAVRASLTPDRADQLAALADAERVRPAVQVPAGALGPAERNGLRDIVDGVESERATARNTVLPAALSLSFVALLLLLRLLGESAGLRRSEFALLSLRGWSRRRLWIFGMAEPAILLLVATPTGVLVGWQASDLLAGSWLYPGLPVELPTGSLLGAVGVLLAGVAAAATALVHVMREQLREQLETTGRPRPPSRIGLAAQTAVVVAAATGVHFVASERPRGDPGLVDLLVPVALVLAIGLLAAHLAALLARWLSKRTAGQASLAAYLSARRLSRRREGTLVVLPLAVALGVGVFAAGVQLAAATWRDSVAASRVGADLAYPSPLPPARTLGLTRQLDPDGEWLMAGAVYADIRPPAMVALDTTRMGTVGVWPDRWGVGRDVAAVADTLAPERAPPRIEGRRLTLDVTNAIRSADSLSVTARLRGESGLIRDEVLPHLGLGSSILKAEIGCRSGCDLVGIHVAGPAGRTTSMRGVLTIHELSVDGRVFDAGLGDPDAWRPVRPYTGPDDRSVATVDADDSGLLLSVDTGGHLGTASITPTDAPDVRPIIMTSGVDFEAAPDLDDVGLLPSAATPGSSPGALPARVVGLSEAIPLLGRPGVLVDLEAYLREDYFEGLNGETSYVLARDGIPEDMVAALADAGVNVDQPLSLAAEKDALSNDAYALSLRLYVVVAAALLLLALAGLAAHLFVGMAGRRYDAASLRVVGVSKRTVMRAGLIDLAVTLGAAAVAGVVAGLVAQRVVLGQIRLGTADSRSPDIPAEINLPMLGVYTAATALVLLVVSATVATASVRRARGAELRESAR